MIKLIHQNVSKIAIAVVVSGMFLSYPAQAHRHSDTSSSGQSRMERVETRIQTLHDKIHVTSAQEEKWQVVAAAMLQNEKTIHSLIKARHENEPVTAVDDLKSYQEIANAHSDGLKNLIPAFETFYAALSDKQKARADELFGEYEGRGKAHKASSARPANNLE